MTTPALKIDDDAFRRGHAAFLTKMQQQDGEPFRGFDHPFFVDDELSFKFQTQRDGRNALAFAKWSKWIEHPGRILAALKTAVKADAMGKLLTHNYGEKGGGYKSLYLVSDEDVPELEGLFYRLYQSSQDDVAIGPVFEEMVEFLKDRSLGRNWEFLSYVLFLMRPDRYFPIHSGSFQRVLDFYGTGHQLSKRFSWEAYGGLLQVADQVKERLRPYGTARAIDVQSYMWVVSYLLEQGRVPDQVDPEPVDFEAELAKRIERDRERERIGLDGEQFVFEAERVRLREANREELANRVRLVSSHDDSAGYDILSFEETGTERRIEVKTTVRPESEYDCFWLTENEVRTAAEDAAWTLCRVWSIDDNPHHRFLGNVVQADCEGWVREPSSWLMRRQ